MRRFARIVALTSFGVLAAAGSARASKITLSVDAGYGSSYSYLNWYPYGQEVDLVDGNLPEFERERTWDARLFGDSWSKFRSFDGPMTLNFVVTEWEETAGGYAGRAIAEGKLSGSATGGISYLSGIEASGSGTAAVSDVTAYEPSKVPDWLPSLRVNFEVKPAEEGYAMYTTVMTVTADASVPEPGSIAAFMAASGAGLMLLRRRQGEAA